MIDYTWDRVAIVIAARRLPRISQASSKGTQPPLKRLFPQVQKAVRNPNSTVLFPKQALLLNEILKSYDLDKIYGYSELEMEFSWRKFPKLISR
jgi:hypothetical protein